MNTDSHADSPLHVVLGAGQVGPRLADLLLARGHRVRIVRRGEAGADRPGLEWARADLTDAAAAARAAAGAAVIYDCTNPAGYGTWDETLPPLKRGIREAAARTGALLVSLDNLYMLGAPADGAPLREDTPMRPRSKKGELRARLATELMEAHARGALRATVGRASDFFGPGAGKMSLYGDDFVRRLARGWGAMVLGDPDLPRSYSYVPDVVAGLAALGARPDLSEGKVFHLPVAWSPERWSATAPSAPSRRASACGTRAFVARFAEILGVAPRTWRMPGWAFRVLGLVSRDVGAVHEMLYQWEMPFVVDDRRFVETFGLGATSVEQAVRETVRAAGFLPSALVAAQAA